MYYRGSIDANENSNGADKAFHAQQVITICRNCNHINNVLFLTTIAGELKHTHNKNNTSQ
jgi:hypothetical protein